MPSRTFFSRASLEAMTNVWQQIETKNSAVIQKDFCIFAEAAKNAWPAADILLLGKTRKGFVHINAATCKQQIKRFD